MLTFFASGTFFYGFSTFFKPIVDEFGWSYTATSTAFAIYRLEGGVAAPIVGYIVDRVGPGKMMAFGSAVFGLGFLAMSRADSLLTFYATMILISAGFSAAAGTVGMAAVANWFVRKRGLALGILMTGAGIGGVLAPVLVRLISLYGWRTTLVILAFSSWFFCLPLSLLVRHRPRDYGYLPDGDTVVGEGKRNDVLAEDLELTKVNTAPEVSFTLGQALRTRSFWIFTLGITFLGVPITGVSVHLIPYLINLGFPPETAALALTAVTLTSVAGRMGFGWLGDRFDKRSALVIIGVVQSLGLLAAAFIGSYWMVALFVLFYAPAYGGGIPLRPALTAEYFGTKAFGAIQGVLMAIFTFGSMLGPILGGWMFDTRGSYRLAFLIFAIL
ncbi:MAG TPA: MFS transporter, partial [Dehalococcoidia bacterium]|nr:MFS transporter [Dehalococcoidia bacterium]